MSSAWSSMTIPSSGNLSTLRVSGVAHPWFWIIEKNGNIGVALQLPTQMKPEWESLIKGMRLALSVQEDYEGGFYACTSVADRELAPVFEKLIWDLVSSCEAADSIAGVFSMMGKRILSWSKLFTSKQRLLSDEKVIGLMSELQFLDEFWLEEVSGKTVKGWEGPKGTSQDFINPDQSLAVEVKAHTKKAKRVKISSEMQLDFEGVLYLYVCEGSVSETDEGKTLNQAVAMIKQKLDVSEHHDFDELLLKAGYSPDPYYDNKKYLLDEGSYFQVGDDFPKITKSNLSTAISNVSYEVDLNFIAEWSSTSESLKADLL